MSYRYRATERFWKSFYELPSDQKESTREAWKIFKQNPFAPALGSHKIHHLSALAGTNIYSAEIEGDLRAIFRIDDNVITTLNIGTHDLYK